MKWDKVITKNLGKGEGWVGFFSYVSKELFLGWGGVGWRWVVFLLFFSSFPKVGGKNV
jgi:hypothetical protein